MPPPMYFTTQASTIVMPVFRHEFDTTHNTPANNYNLWLAIAFAGAIHLFILSQFKFNLPMKSLPITLKLTLQSFEKRVDKQIVPTTIVQDESPLIANDTNQITKKIVANTEENIAPNKTARDSTPSLYNRTITTLRNNGYVRPKKHQSFSTGDFPKPAGKQKYRRKSALRTIISAPSLQEFRNNDGSYIIKRSDGFGNITCYEERGLTSVFELTNPPLWYKIPASTCQHIKP